MGKMDRETFIGTTVDWTPISKIHTVLPFMQLQFLHVETIPTITELL